MERFLAADEYADFDADNIQAKASELFSDGMSDIEKAQIAFEFMRDEIRHSFDCGATTSALAPTLTHARAMMAFSLSWLSNLQPSGSNQPHRKAPRKTALQQVNGLFNSTSQHNSTGLNQHHSYPHSYL